MLRTLLRKAATTLLWKRTAAGVALTAAAVITIKDVSGKPTKFQHLFTGGVGPRATPKATSITVFDDERLDNYYWLRDDERKNEEVLALCKAENEHMSVGMSGTEELQNDIVKEIRSRMKEDDSSLPSRSRGYYYYTRMETGKQYPIWCRRGMSAFAALLYTPEDAMDDISCPGEEEVLLDGNKDSEGKSYYQVSGLRPSPSNRYIAYGLDTVGRESYTLTIVDTHAEGGPKIISTIENTTGSAAWINDRNLLYTTRDEAHRPDKVWLHAMVPGYEGNHLVFHEPDETFNVFAYRSRSGDYMYIGSGGAVTSEVFVFPAKHLPRNKKIHLTSVCGRTTGVEYSVSDRNGIFYVVTNKDGAVNSKLLSLEVNVDDFKGMNTPLTDHEDSVVKELFPHREDVKFEGVTLYKDFLVSSERRNGLPVLSVHSFDVHGSLSSGKLVNMPDASYSMWESAQEFESCILRYNYTSQTTPKSTFDVNMNDLDAPANLRKVDPVPGNFCKNNYVSKRVYATSHDGEKIPISIVHHKDVGEGPHPVVLEGYGAYEISNDVYFSRAVLSLLDRGVVVAVAHIRGGGEMGRMWYEKGKYLHKKNTYLDFIASAQHLLDTKVAHPDKLCIEGWSAGGLLIGATLNNAPKKVDGTSMFAGAVAGVPFVDVLTTMLDETIPLTAGEWDEWGDPREKKYYDYMKSYSPIDNVSPLNGPYPPVFIQGGLHDPRVQYWEPLKYAQVLRDVGAQTVLCKIDMSSGHFSSSGRFDRLKDTALYFAFFLRAMGVEKASLLPNGPCEDTTD
eukprot:m.32388 g.32388  ORF g.32388 m.32388 type:complete len:789 (+) comp6381_c0_seq1:94-2460(+)